MNDDRQRFEEYLAKFKGCYQSIEVRLICGRREGKWRNIWTRIEFTPEEVESAGQPHNLFCTDFVRADRVTVPLAETTALLDAVENEGKLRVEDVEVIYPREGNKPEELGLRLRLLATPPGFGGYEGLASWYSIRLHRMGPELLNQYLDIDSSDLDYHLKAQPSPYLGIADLLSDFGKRHSYRRSPDARSGVTVVAPVMVAFGGCLCGERKLHIRVEAHPSFTQLPVRVGIVERGVDDTVKRGSIDIEREDWKTNDGDSVFEQEMDVEPGVRVNLTLSAAQVLVDEESLQEPSILMSHSRLAVQEFFDGNLSQLGKFLEGKGKYSENVETGMAWLLHVCGFSSVRLGGSGLQSEVDVLAFSQAPPALLAVECTTAPADLSKKLNDLIHRSSGLREVVQGVPIFPVLFVCGKNYNLSEQDKEEAGRAGVAIVDDGDALELLSKGRRGLTAGEALKFLEERVPASRENPLGRLWGRYLGRVL